MARPRRTKRDAPERKPKKKVSILDTERIVWVDYKDVALLRRFMSERAKIRARRVTGNDAQQQRAVARAIRVAREMALLPYSVRQVTHHMAEAIAQLNQRPAVMREHVRQEHGLEREDAAFDGRDLSFDPVAQNRVDGDVALA